MAQTLDLSTKIQGGQYDGKTLQEVIGSDIEYVKLQIRLGNFVLREGASRVMDGFKRASVKQQKVEYKKKGEDITSGFPSMQELRIEATKVVEAFIAGIGDITEEEVISTISVLPDEIQKPYLLQMEEYKLKMGGKQQEESELQELRETVKSTVDSFLASEDGVTEENARDIVSKLPEKEQEEFIQSIDLHKVEQHFLPTSEEKPDSGEKEQEKSKKGK